MSGASYRQFALDLLLAESLEAKLLPPARDLADDDPGPPLRLAAPGRPPELRIRADAEVRVPGLPGMADPAQRVRILHAFGNHELQAVELFAWALLAFPDSPRAFRDGLMKILAEEQHHVRWYVERLADLETRLGDFPINGYFWGKTPGLLTPAHFVCAMGLTWENANLDHSTDYAAAAREAGDTQTATLLDRIHRDEIGHVRFGWKWLSHFKPEDSSMWTAYCDNVDWPLRPALARGRSFDVAGREAAGLDEEFIRKLSESDR